MQSILIGYQQFPGPALYTVGGNIARGGLGCQAKALPPSARDAVGSQLTCGAVTDAAILQVGTGAAASLASPRSAPACYDPRHDTIPDRPNWPDGVGSFNRGPREYRAGSR